MDKATAVLLVENLLGRLERDSSSRARLEGLISAQELQALEWAVSTFREMPEVSQAEPEPAPSSPPAKAPFIPVAPEAPVVAPVAAMARTVTPRTDCNPPREDTVLSLDFGTARSKAAASRTHDGTLQVRPLALGTRAGETRSPYSLSSALWVEEDGTVLFGDRAVKRSVERDDPDRQRIDSLKQHLSQGAQGLLSTPLERALNPTATRLTFDDAITLYLAYLTDVAESELEAGGLPRNAIRRFAYPAWSKEKIAEAEPLLRSMLVRAQVVARAFSGEWSSGITVRDVREVMDRASTLNGGLPVQLVRESVLEPVAAGTSRLATGDPNRQLAMVIDVGAGTTDFALFIVVEDPDSDRFKIFPIDGARDGIRQAGDTVDNILLKAILENAEVSQEASDYRFITANLRLSIRDLKETLFRNQFVDYRLTNDRHGSITLASFLERRETKVFEDQIAGRATALVEALDRESLRLCHERGMRVILTGGGATLPMLKSSSHGATVHHGLHVRRELGPLIPPSLEGTPLATEYLPLAVAIGGAYPLPKVGTELKAVLGASRSLVVPPTSWC